MSGWRFLLDENIDPKTATYLDKERIDAEHVRDALELGAADDEILSYAREYDRIVVTSDVADFSDLDPDDHASVVLLFDDTTPAYDVAAGLLAIVDSYPGRDEFPPTEILDAWL